MNEPSTPTGSECAISQLVDSVHVNHHLTVYLQIPPPSPGTNTSFISECSREAQLTSLSQDPDRQLSLILAEETSKKLTSSTFHYISRRDNTPCAAQRGDNAYF